MIKIDKKEIPACCGSKHLILKLNASILKEHTTIFTKAGFSFLKGFYDAGILYIEDSGLTATCNFGSNLFNIKCKNKQCDDSIKNLERTLLANFK